MSKKPHSGPLCICVACEEAAAAAAERRGFIKGLEAARRIANRELRKWRRNVNFTLDDVTQAITARIEREKAKR